MSKTNQTAQAASQPAMPKPGINEAYYPFDVSEGEEYLLSVMRHVREAGTDRQQYHRLRTWMTLQEIARRIEAGEAVGEPEYDAETVAIGRAIYDHMRNQWDKYPNSDGAFPWEAKEEAKL